MLRDIQESLVGGAKPVNQYPSVSDPEKRLFNAFELRLFRYTAVLLCLVALTALIGSIVWTVGWVLSAFYNLLLSLAIAGVLALVLHPVVEFLEKRLHLPHLLAIMVVLVVFFASIGGLIFLLVPIVVRQGAQLMTVLPDTLASWQDHFSWRFSELSSLLSSLNGSSEEGQESEAVLPVLEDPGSAIKTYLGVLAGISFVPLFLFFALFSGNLLRGQASELLSVFHKNTQQKVLYFMEVFVEYVTAFFQGQLLIALCMGALYAIGFTLVGLEYGVLVAIVLGLLNIVPFLGTLIGLLVALPMAYFQADSGFELLILTGLVFAAVQVVEAWLLTPKIMANRSGLHPALVVISLFFWGTVLGGIIGMILAVPLTAFFVAIWREIKGSLKHALSSRTQKHEGSG